MAKTKKYLKSRKSKKCRKSRKNFRYKHRGGTIDESSDVLPKDIQSEIETDLTSLEKILEKPNSSQTQLSRLSRFAPIFYRYSCKNNAYCELIKATIYFVLLMVIKAAEPNSIESEVIKEPLGKYGLIFINKFVIHILKYLNICEKEGSKYSEYKNKKFNDLDPNDESQFDYIIAIFLSEKIKETRTIRSIHNLNDSDSLQYNTHVQKVITGRDIYNWFKKNLIINDNIELSKRIQNIIDSAFVFNFENGRISDRDAARIVQR